MTRIANEIDEYEIEAIWSEEFERDYRRYVGDVGSGSDPVSDQQLWRYIKYHAGGLKRDRTYWDDRASVRENRAAFRYLDRGWKLGRNMDELAQAIGMEWPWYEINTDEDLWSWMQRTRRC